MYFDPITKKPEPPCFRKDVSEYDLHSKNLVSFTVLLTAGLIQDPLFANAQLLLRKPSLFPILEAPSLFDAALFLVASFPLILRRNDIGKPEWWGGFLTMALPYFALKWIGVYYDQTNYLIANYEGRTLGGGAAMAHMPLILYILGPAQLIRKLGFTITRKAIKQDEKKPLNREL